MGRQVGRERGREGGREERRDCAFREEERSSNHSNALLPFLPPSLPSSRTTGAKQMLAAHAAHLEAVKQNLPLASTVYSHQPPILPSFPPSLPPSFSTGAKQMLAVHAAHLEAVKQNPPLASMVEKLRGIKPPGGGREGGKEGGCK